MSTYAFAGYGVPETFIVNGKRVLACRLEVMFTAANLGFDGRFSEKNPARTNPLFTKNTESTTGLTGTS